MSTVQELFHTFYPTYKETYKLSMEQAKAATNMMNCRTASMGGHSYECESCSHSLVRYNSC
jgi:Transposase zinc-binding domain